MTPERWRDVERIYHAALERDGDQRAAFLADACKDDPALRREVESLLAYRTKASDFIETPVADAHPALAAIVSREHSLLQARPSPGQFVGRVFGVYQIKALIATGGMGEIYRGLDTRLQRTVAIKTLSAHMSQDPAWRERFRREAQSVSRLNHPHICTLYDVGIEGDVQYLVMEHIEGETLEARLARGPLPLAASLQYLMQIAEALDEAHRGGVVHRDVKPSNVMLTKSGAKVLDFGLATQTRGGVLDGSLAETAPALTAAGTIVGTPQYMAPEQIEGKPLDARTDMFSFGVMAYEMLTGGRAFRADSPARLISAILRDDPKPIAELAPEVPWLLERTISRCLAKAPEDRWQTANDLLFQLRTIASAHERIEGPQSRVIGRSRAVERAVWVAIVILAIASAWMWSRRQVVPASAPRQGIASVRFTISPPAGTTFASSQDVPLALSPDGRSLVFVAAGTDGVRRLWLRALDLEGEHASVLSGTEGANTPFWSPDSQWIAFFAGDSLKKLRVSTGVAQIVANSVSTFAGASWGAGDVILFPAGPGGLSRVSAQGGSVSQITKGEGHFWPQFLPDGTHYLYASAAPARVMIGALGNEAHRTLTDFPVRISALVYAAGHVFFVQDRELFARPFDPVRLEFSGAATRVLQGIPVVGNGRAPFSVSTAGVLAYWPQPIGEPAVLQWFDRDGRAAAAVSAPARYLGFALSPDARQLVFSRMDASGGADLWLRDMDRGSEEQLTFDAASYTPRFSPDAARILFSGPGPGPPPKMFVRAVTGAGTVSRVGSAASPDFVSSWTGDWVVSVRIDSVNRNDLWLHRISDGSDTRLSVNTAFNESHGKVSPDGRWLAYVTDQSGRDEVWIATLPSCETRRQLSTGGGTVPEWSEGGKELFYLSLDRHVMAVSMSGYSGADVGATNQLFQMPNLIAEGRVIMPTSNNYVATRDGRRFLAAVSAPDPNASPLNIIVNWPAALNRGGR